MEEITLENENGEILASSREIADKFGKRNPDVNRAIENLTVQNSTVRKMFYKSTYKSSRGREETEYKMNRDGFSLLVMGFTGAKALEWKLKYIEAFNKMEQVLIDQNQKALPSSYKEAIQQLLNQIEENEQLLEQNKQLEPKAIIVDNMIKNDSAVTTTIAERIKNTGTAKIWNRKMKSGEIKGTTITVLEYIHEFINNNGYCPSIREICTGIGVASTSTVQAHMVKLNNLGYLVKNHKETRNMRVNEEKYALIMKEVEA